LRGKHTSLSAQSVSSAEKQFYNTCTMFRCYKTLAPCFDVIKHFFSLSLTPRTNQQGCLQLVSFYSLVYYLWYVQEPICDTLRFSPWTNSFLANIRLGCVCFLGTNTLAYLPEAMKKKEVFINFPPE